MDSGVQELQKKVAEVEVCAEELLLARHELVECDRARNGNREALTAMRRQARTSRSSVGAQGDAETCRTCGDHDGSAPVWYMCPGLDVFVRRPFHGVHSQLEQEQASLDLRVKSLQGVVKEKTLQLSNAGALADRFAPGIVNALVYWSLVVAAEHVYDPSVKNHEDLITIVLVWRRLTVDGLLSVADPPLLCLHPDPASLLQVVHVLAHDADCHSPGLGLAPAFCSLSADLRFWFSQLEMWQQAFVARHANG